MMRPPNNVEMKHGIADLSNIREFFGNSFHTEIVSILVADVLHKVTDYKEMHFAPFERIIANILLVKSVQKSLEICGLEVTILGIRKKIGVTKTLP